MNPITGLPIQEEKKTLSKEQHYTPHNLPPPKKKSIFSIFEEAPLPPEKQRLQAEIEEGQHMIKSGEEKLFQDLNHIYNWDDSDHIPRNVEAMMEFINTKTNKRILAQVDALFAYYYTHILGGRENPLLSRETDDRTKDLIRISFLLNLIKDERFGEHDKYMGYDTGRQQIQDLLTSVIMRKVLQRRRDERLDSAIKRSELETTELEGEAEELKEQSAFGATIGANDIDEINQRYQYAHGKVVSSRAHSNRLKTNHPYKRFGGKKKRRSTCKKRRRKRNKTNKTRLRR